MTNTDAEVVEIRPGTGLRITVDKTVYGVKSVHPLDRGRTVHDNSEDASDMVLQPSPNGGVKGRDDPEVEVQFVSEGHRQAVGRVPSLFESIIGDVYRYIRGARDE